MPSFPFEAIGTRWQIDIAEALAAPEEQALLRAIHQRIAAFDATYSRFRDDAWVARLARHAGVYELPSDAAPLFALYQDLYRHTNGAMTPLIGQTMVEAGYDATYSLQPKTLHTPPKWEDVLIFNENTVTMLRPALLDFGAAGKGYLIDLVGDVIRAAGITSYCINAGGDILQRSTSGKSVRIGLEHPGATTQVIGVASLANASICGSAGNRRAWGDYHHIIHPHTLQSPRDIVATWVVAETAMLADALATAVYFVSPEMLAPHYQFAYLLMRYDGAVAMSPNFPGELFTRT